MILLLNITTFLTYYSLESSPELAYGAPEVILRYLQPFSLQASFKRANIRVRTCAYLLLQDGPNRIINRIQVRTGRWPLLFGNEVNFLFSEPLLGGVSCVSWSTILLEGPTRISKILTTETLHFSIQNEFTVGFRIDFYPSRDKNKICPGVC